jgi:Cu/Ag efflux pump CusA
LGLSLVAAALVPTLPTGLMPDMDEGAFVMDFMAPGGTPLQTTDQQVRIIEQELRATPEVAAYSRRTGLEMGFFTTEPNRGDLMVKLKSHAQRKRSMRDVMEDVEKRCAARLPGMTLETMAPIADRVADIAGEPTPIQIKIFGDDPAVLKRLGDQVNEVVASIRGTSESVHGANLTGPELSIRVDPRRAGMLGLTPQDVAAALEAEIEGREDTSVVIGERVIGVRVMYPRRFRRTLEELRQLKLLSKDHRQVPLSAIADFKEVPGVYEVLRENQKPVSVVSAALTGRDVGSANREAQQKIAEKVPLPPGYTVQFGGLYATQQASFAGLLGVLLLGMFLVYLVTLFQYNRFGEPTALVLAALFALVGVVAALKLTGTLLNASSLTGAIMIFGMVLTNGIVLMDTIQARTAEGLPLAEAIIAAGQQRLRPVFMTASIAVLALLPLAFGIGSGAEMQQPLAVAVIGGLVVSPFFALLLAPLLLYVLRRGR